MSPRFKLNLCMYEYTVTYFICKFHALIVILKLLANLPVKERKTLSFYLKNTT